MHNGRHWYFVALDVTRGEWRTFRADRVTQVTPTGQPAAALPDPPDPALLVSQNTAGGLYPLYASIRLPLPLDQALHLVPTTVGTHRPDGPDATIVDVGGPDADGLAKYLLSLATPLRVLAPDAVRQALVRLLRSLHDHNEDDAALP